MRRWNLLGRRCIEFEENAPVPRPDADEVLVRVKSCTVCGRSDLVYYHYLHLRDHCANGIFGHEISGVVESVGPQVSRVQCGERVFIRTPLTTGYADYALAREIAVGRLPEQIPFDQGSILQILPLCVHATRGVSLGDHVLIVGQGPIGQMALQITRLRGASRITVLDLDPWRLETSRGLGADQVVAVGPHLGLDIHDLGVFDVAIEAVGTPTTAKWCVDAVRQGGTVIFLGTHHVDTKITFDLVQWEMKGIRVLMAAEPNDDTRVAALRTSQNLVDNGRVKLAPLLTESIPLDQLPVAIERLSKSPLLYSNDEPSEFDLPPKQTLKLAICT